MNMDVAFGAGAGHRYGCDLHWWERSREEAVFGYL